MTFFVLFALAGVVLVVGIAAWAARSMTGAPRLSRYERAEREIAKLEYELKMPPSTDYGREHYRPELYRDTSPKLRPSSGYSYIRNEEGPAAFENLAKSLSQDSLAKEVARAPEMSNRDYAAAMVTEMNRRLTEQKAKEVAKAAQEKMDHLFDLPPRVPPGE